MARLFEYVVIHTPKKKEGKDLERAKILVPVTHVLAGDEKEVTILASRDIPEDYLGRLEEVDIAVRPF